jgi:hypothetical protein
MLHPDVEWHPSPKLLEIEVLRGRREVRHLLQALHDRFGQDLEIIPEDGRQIGDHVLLIAMLQGVNQFTRRGTKSRECWVVTVRDDLWVRIVVFPNAPAARLGFEEALRAAPIHHDVSTEPVEVTLSPAEVDPEIQAETDGRHDDLTLTFTLEELVSLEEWLKRPADDGSLAAYDSDVWPGLMKIRSAVQHAQAIAEIRRELAEANGGGIELSDDQLVELGRRIALVTQPLLTSE